MPRVMLRKLVGRHCVVSSGGHIAAIVRLSELVEIVPHPEDDGDTVFLT